MDEDRIIEIVIAGAANLGLFVSAALVLLLIPGPAVLYIIGRSAEQGRLAGLLPANGDHERSSPCQGATGRECHHVWPRPNQHPTAV